MVRQFVACCVALAVLEIASGLALLHCPFLAVSASCCRGTSSSKKCPLSNSFESCPYVQQDAKIEPANGSIAILAMPALIVNAPVLPAIRMPAVPAQWTPALSGLHLRIRVLLI